MARRTLLFALALLALSASPAAAQTVTVNFSGNSYSPPEPRIQPGESVSLPDSETHPLAGDAPITGDGGTVVFPDAGAYRFYCQVHGGSGMRGVVRVGTVAPVADIAVQGSPTSGSSVTLSAAGTTDSDEVQAGPGFPHPNDPRTYEWDFTNDGVIDQTTTTATVQHTYPTAGAVTARVRVTDRTDTSGEDTVSFTVAEGAANRAPVAALSFSPASPVAGEAVALDASGSSDPDGNALAYSWDLDGNGTFETNTNSAPTVSVTFAGSGTHTVRVRVSDGALTADAARDITVSAPPAGSQPLPPGGTSGPVVGVDNVALSPTIRRVGKRVGRRVKVRVTCPATEKGGCKGTLRARVGRRRLQAQRFNLRAGRSRTLTFKVPRSGPGSLVLSGSTTDAAGNRTTIKAVVRF